MSCPPVFLLLQRWRSPDRFSVDQPTFQTIAKFQIKSFWLLIMQDHGALVVKSYKISNSYPGRPKHMFVRYCITSVGAIPDDRRKKWHQCMNHQKRTANFYSHTFNTTCTPRRAHCVCVGKPQPRNLKLVTSSGLMKVNILDERFPGSTPKPRGVEIAPHRTKSLQFFPGVCWINSDCEPTKRYEAYADRRSSFFIRRQRQSLEALKLVSLEGTGP